MAINRKGGLGKGLDALFADNATDESNSAVTLKITEIEPNLNQPRKDFDHEALEKLSESIATHGIIQPLLVRPLMNGRYQIVAGERRWRAANMAALSEVPVVIKELSDKEVSELALIENLQREDLNPIEEAEGFKNLIENYSMTQEVLAERVGKSRTAITNSLRLLNLPQDVLNYVKTGDLSGSQARTILAFKTEERMIEVADLAVNEGLTVRKLEEMAKKENSGEEKVRIKPARDSYYDEVEIALTQTLSRRIKVVEKKKGKGVLQIEFFSPEDLKNIANLLDNEE